ncbi:hypothetical protein [Bradyrhizobium neotropicale]|uniref:Uncharacterized protein n=1 Tax=Bradyrhizobium neotropicale TaxID=1497615 RepID=A0A176YM20_9BRAD|nr:hypothetical protein [Bradyrhizobium neotropicale]OAF07302.1 hypothetical protein AXW67_30740 [Bradyrhizobium neotropicale]
MLTCIVIGSMAASVALADPRDAVDRGQRLDTDALRDDAATHRLRQPSHPLDIAPHRPAPNAKATNKKSGMSSSR